ncbi:MAG: cyclodeaminase/cyclohydrolase family protein [Veillonellales bacterium]
MLHQLSIHEFSEKLAAATPPPGGGSVAALSGLTGAGLLEMVLQVSGNCPEFAGESVLFTEKKNCLAKLHQQLEQLIDRDAAVLRQLLEVYRAREKDSTIARTAFQNALREAAEVPLVTARACLEVLEISRSLLGRIHPLTAGDLAVGALTSYAGLRGALLNTAMNVKQLEDDTLVSALHGQVVLLSASAETLIADIRDNFRKNEDYVILRDI